LQLLLVFLSAALQYVDFRAAVERLWVVVAVRGEEESLSLKDGIYNHQFPSDWQERITAEEVEIIVDSAPFGGFLLVLCAGSDWRCRYRACCRAFVGCCCSCCQFSCQPSSTRLMKTLSLIESWPLPNSYCLPIHLSCDAAFVVFAFSFVPSLFHSNSIFLKFLTARAFVGCYYSCC